MVNNQFQDYLQLRSSCINFDSYKKDTEKQKEEEKIKRNED